MATRKKAEVAEVEVVTPLTPKMLASELGLKDGKRLRAYLRANFPRTAEEKNSSWNISDEAAAAAREYFSKKNEEKDEASA